MIPETIKMRDAVKRYKIDKRSLTTLIKSGVIKAYRPVWEFHIDVESADRWYIGSEVKPKGRPRGTR